jgi:hypothetical protein
MDMQNETMPMLSVPVERSLNTTAAAQAEGVDQSTFTGGTFKIFGVPLPFADDGDE